MSEANNSDEALPFGLFGDAFELDNEEDDIKRKPNRRADPKEIEKMCRFIGGFENWSLLIDDCKQKVIEFLDYKTAFSLSFCSKSDYEIVNNTPLFVHNVEIFDNDRNPANFQMEDFDNVVVKVQLHRDFNTGIRFERIFSQLGEDTQIRWTQYSRGRRPEKKEVIWKNCNYYQKAAEFAEKWIKRGNFGLESLKVEMEKYPMESSIVKFLPKCTDIRVCSRDENVFRWWLNKVPAQLNDIELLTDWEERDNFVISREFLSNSQIMTARKFYLYCEADLSDEQLMDLKATQLSLNAVSITDEGINEYVKRWVNGKGVKGFTQALIWKERDYDIGKIIQGLEVRPWDDDFEDEARGFCGDFDRVCGRGTTYQVPSKVDPYESLTVDISSNGVSIYHTGKKHVWNGKAYTSYGIP